mgnify:CR=1 FL=1
MKGVIASAVIAAVIVAGSVAYTNHIDKVSRELGEINDRVMAFLYDEDYESAGDEIEKLVQYLDENRTVLAATGNHEDFDKIEMNDFIEKLLENLNELERNILMERYFKKSTQIAIAKKFQISQMTVSRIEKKVLEKLKKEIEKNLGE